MKSGVQFLFRHFCGRVGGFFVCLEDRSILFAEFLGTTLFTVIASFHCGACVKLDVIC